MQRPWYVIGPSEAVLFRKVHRDAPTVLLDEFDTIYRPGKGSDNYEGVRQIFNAGHRRGASVPRCLNRGAKLEEFQVFGAKLLAGIGSLPDTVADRSIPIRLERKRKSEQVERFRRREVEPGGYALRDQIAAWADEHLDDLAEARPDMPEELSDRMQEGCELLMAIADELNAGERVRAALVKVCTGERLDDEESIRLRLLRDIRRVFAAREKQRGARIKGMYTQPLLKRLRALEEAPWASWKGHGLTDRDLAFFLHPYGLKSKPLRMRETVRRGYYRSDLKQAWDRYL